MARLRNLIAFAISFGAFAALVYWGLSLSQRKSDAVKILRAPQGPARVQSDVHGGHEFDYQGLSVNRVQESGKADKTTNRVVLAPRTETLSPEDVPGLTPKLSQIQTVTTPLRPPQAQGIAQPDVTEIPKPLAQLGQYETAQEAQAKWQNIKRKYADIIGDKHIHIIAAQISGKPAHHLQLSGFSNTDELNSFCIALQVQGQNCKPIQTP